LKLSLKYKLAFAASLIALLSVAAVTLVQRGRLEEDLRQVVVTQQEALANSLARDLDDKLDMHLGLLRQVAAAGTAGDLATEEARQRFLRRIGGMNQWFDSTVLFDLQGEVQDSLPEIPVERRINVSDRAYFRDVLNTRKAVVSAPLRSRTRNGPVVVMAAPVVDDAGRVLAVLSMALDLQRSNILGSLNQHPVGQTGHIELVHFGDYPQYVVHPEPAMLLAEASRNGDEPGWLVSRVSLSSVPWELRVLLPDWEVDAPGRAAQRRQLGALVVTGLAVALIAWWAAYLLLRPLTTLSQAIQTLRRQPDAPVRLDTRGGDERGELAREFQGLMDSLRERQEELAAVSAASPLGLFRTDAGGEITWVNEAFLRIHGLEDHEKARGWTLLLPPEQREKAWEAWVRIVAGTEPHRVHMRMTLRDGRQRVLEIRTMPLHSHGVVRGHVGAVTDVTDRVEAERAQRMLAAVLDATTDFVVQTDPTGRVTYMNPAVRVALGFDADHDVRRHHFTEFNTDDTNQRYEGEILPAVLSRGIWLGDTTVKGAGGRVVLVSHMVIAHRDKRGRIEHFSAVMRDMSAKREAEREIQRQTATLSAVAEAMPAVVAVVGADGCYRFVNRAFEAWLGRPRDQVVGRSLQEVLGEQDFERSRPWMVRALAGEAVQFERDYISAGHTSHLAVSYIPLRLADGSVDGFLGVAQDVSTQRIKEARLLHQAERDALSGLLNRAGFGRWLDQALADGQGPTLAVLYIDLDHFKPVNDRHGHAMGDRLLQAFARRLRDTVRPSDAVARLGGDEFAVALLGVREEVHAQAVAAKVLQVAHEPFELDGHVLQIGASVGLAIGVDPGEDWQALVQRADTQLYAAKAGGRGRLAG